MSTTAAAVKPKKTLFSQARPFVLGGLSASAALVIIQPIDIVKVRIQLSSEGGKIPQGPFQIARNVYHNEGFIKFYAGLSAGLLRQVSYGTARLGIFRSLSDKLSDNGANPLSFAHRVGIGMTAGFIASIIGTPADVSLIRMQSDMSLPVSQRRGYKHVFDALFQIYKQEGVRGWFTGAVPTVSRAVAINGAMLSSFDQTKDILQRQFGASMLTVFAASCFSGFLSSAASLPFDFVKTRIQKQVKGPDGKYPYDGFFDCVQKVIKAEGPFAFYRGFLTYFSRVAPHTMLTLCFMDGLLWLCKQYKI